MTDLSVLTADGPVEFTRTYRSAVGSVGPLGHKWTHNWEERLYTGTTSYGESCGSMVKWVRPDGGTLDFPVLPQGLPGPAAPDAVHRLVKVSSTEYQIRGVDGSLRSFTQSASSSGTYRLMALEDGPLSVALQYDAEERLVSVGPLDITYAPPGEPATDRIWSVTNHDHPSQTVGCSIVEDELVQVSFPALALYPRRV